MDELADAVQPSRSVIADLDAMEARAPKQLPAARDSCAASPSAGRISGSNTFRLLQLLDVAGADALEEAQVGVLERNTVHIGAVRQVLDKRRSDLGLPYP